MKNKNVIIVVVALVVVLIVLFGSSLFINNDKGLNTSSNVSITVNTISNCKINGITYTKLSIIANSNNKGVIKIGKNNFMLQTDDDELLDATSCSIVNETIEPGETSFDIKFIAPIEKAVSLHYKSNNGDEIIIDLSNVNISYEEYNTTNYEGIGKYEVVECSDPLTGVYALMNHDSISFDFDDNSVLTYHKDDYSSDKKKYYFDDDMLHIYNFDGKGNDKDLLLNTIEDRTVFIDAEDTSAVYIKIH